MTDTKSEPLTADERAILKVVRASGLGVEKTCEVITRAVMHKPEPDAPPVNFDHTYAEAREMAVSICRKAAVDFHEAEARLARGRERAAHMKHVTGGCTDAETPSEEAEWARWLDALETGRNDAERRLIGCILMDARRIDRVDEIDEQDAGWKPVAFEIDGPHYVVAPRSKDDPRPRLIVVECGHFDSQDYGASGGMPDFFSGKTDDETPRPGGDELEPDDALEAEAHEDDGDEGAEFTAGDRQRHVTEIIDRKGWEWAYWKLLGN